jgi:hypothetical protein
MLRAFIGGSDQLMAGGWRSGISSTAADQLAQSRHFRADVSATPASRSGRRTDLGLEAELGGEVALQRLGVGVLFARRFGCWKRLAFFCCARRSARTDKPFATICCASSTPFGGRGIAPAWLALCGRGVESPTSRCLSRQYTVDAVPS